MKWNKQAHYVLVHQLYIQTTMYEQGFFHAKSLKFLKTQIVSSSKTQKYEGPKQSCRSTNYLSERYSVI